MKIFIILGVFAMIGWNAILIQRDQQFFKAYDACRESIQHPDCPYIK
jgi:hypothetical protein